MKIIDAHLHIFPSEPGTDAMARGVGHENSVEHLRQVYGELEIVHGVVMGNRSLETGFHNYPRDLFHYCVGLDSLVLRRGSHIPEDLPDQVEEHLKRENCCGVKLYPGYNRIWLSDPVYEPVYRLAERYDKPVAVHMGLTAHPRAHLKYSHPLALDEAAARADVIAVSDQYRCGVVTPAVRARLSALARTMPVIVDSRERATEYTGVIVKPNEVEAALAVGRDITGLTLTDEEYAEIGCALQKKNGRPVVVTLGERGALWCEEDGAVLAPTVRAEPPVDIVGAGDTFLSAFACAFAAGAAGGEALAFANLASGVTVKKIGTTGTATSEEILEKYRENHA